MRGSIADVLKECRQRAGLSQEQLAYRLCIDQAIVSKIENDKIPPAYELVKRWAKVTESVDLVEMDLGGGKAWKKMRQLEEAAKSVRSIMESISLLKLGGRKGGKRSEINA